MAVAIPEAFGDLAPLFAGAYVALQVVRNALQRRTPTPRDNDFHIVVSPASWSWSVALGRRCGSRAASPPTSTPACGSGSSRWRSTTRRPSSSTGCRAARSLSGSTFWDVETTALRRAVPALHDHRARRVHRRHGGDDLAARPRRGDGHRLRRSPFLGTAAILWWLYFTYVARRSRSAGLALAANRTSLARDGYTYLHVVMVAGIVLAVVGDACAIAHPGDTRSRGPRWRRSSAARRSTSSATRSSGFA